MRCELLGAGLTLQLLWGCAQHSPAVPPPLPPAAVPTQQEVESSPVVTSHPAAAAKPKADEASNQASPQTDLQEPAATQPKSVAAPVAATPAQPPPPPAERSEPKQQKPAAAASPQPRDPVRAESPPAGPSIEPYVALAQFTTQIEDHEPMDAISFLDDRNSEIIFFTDLRGFGGQTLSHRWEYRGQVMAEVPIPVNHDRWRAWSSKQLLPVWTGDWTVSVVNSEGEVIASETFNYSKRP